MWVAVTFAAIVLFGTAFLVWFLLALLRELAPSVCSWAVPAGRRPEKQRDLAVLRGLYADEDCYAPEVDRDYRPELLENENYAKEECASGLIALDVRPASAKLGRRSIQRRYVYVVRERRLRFGSTKGTAGNAG
jgi:hypothetical protein